jgi:hypothetical protein
MYFLNARIVLSNRFHRFDMGALMLKFKMYTNLRI